MLAPPEKYITDNHSAFYYTYMIHDLANKDITKHNPSTPKSSPPYDQIKAYYFKSLGILCTDCPEIQVNIIGKDFWGYYVWTMIHLFGATLQIENAPTFKRLLQLTSKLLPCDHCNEHFNELLEEHKPDSYLRNNHDAFFYTYMLHDLVNKKISKYNPNDERISPHYDVIKAHYFRSLGEDCSDCKV